MDFTLRKYKELLQSLKNGGYQFVTMEELVAAKLDRQNPLCCLRHDVDAKPKQSLRTAQIEHAMGIRATYYFRVTRGSNHPFVIKQIAALGHEIGYHYEDMSICNGDVEKAYQHFVEHLAYFRQFYPVKTICMHGAPTSKYDGRDLWKTYDYKALDITCEPYLDLDYSQILYLTDTGRRWDGYKVSLRDKIPVYQDQWAAQGLTFHSTNDVMDYVEVPRYDEKNLLITTHPQRWTNNLYQWHKELFAQSVKNVVKRVLVLVRKKN